MMVVLEGGVVDSTPHNCTITFFRSEIHNALSILTVTVCRETEKLRDRSVEGLKRKRLMSPSMRKFCLQVAFGLGLQLNLFAGSLAFWPALQILDLASPTVL